jgi:uridylate kinase
MTVPANPSPSATPSPSAPRDARSQDSSKPDPASTTARGRRILLKLSGESFCKPGGFGIDPGELAHIAGEVRDASQAGAQLAVVVGGGNFIRGADLAATGAIHQAVADHMGMLGTVINAIALKEKLTAEGVDARALSAIEMRTIAETFIRGRAIRHLEKGRVVVLAAGTGNPFFTTDTCAALRASELDCDILLKATKVDGIYSADPKKDPKAVRYDTLTFTQAIDQRLKVMDLSAMAMCSERNIPVVVFDFKRHGNIARVVRGERIGTLVSHA